MRSPLLALLPLAAILATADAHAETRRYALAVYHFNVQYVAGGVREFWEDLGSPPNWDGLDMSDEGVQDAIIVESFVPLLELYAAHPDWGADFELQGLMVDAIRQRHPDVLALMRQLADAGAVDFDSFHYSDELWTAQPKVAIEHSYQDTVRAFEDAGLRHGGSFFTQEGQFGLGMADIIPEGGVGMIARNLFGLHYPVEDRRPLFDAGQGRWATVAGHGWSVDVDGTTIQATWTYMDDGELLATGDLNPYFLPSFVAKPEKVAAYEEQVQALVDQGYQPASVATVAADLLATGYAPEPIPPLVDGTWQPRNTANLGLWMGDVGTFPATESDGAVRAGYAQAFREVRMAELLSDGPSEALDQAWRELALGGVSDATGWNPSRGEVAYAFTHQGAARDLVEPLLLAAEEAAIPLDCPELARFSGVDGAITCVASPEARRVETAPGWPGAVAGVADPDRVTVAERCFTDPDIPDAVAWSVTFSGQRDAVVPLRRVEIPWSSDVVRFVPAGRRDAFSEVPLALFSAAAEPVGVPLAGGILDLGGEDRLVLDPTATGLAARVHPDEGEVTFLDASPGHDEQETWIFWFVQGDEAALDLADRLVQRPDLEFTPPVAPSQPTPELPTDCGCHVLPHRGSAAPALALLLLGAVRRRRIGSPGA